MANQPRTRKRVHSLRRAPDGSAFQHDYCGMLVAIGLWGMHDCEGKRNVTFKRFKGQFENERKHAVQSFANQPRSPFRFFMEEFEKAHFGQCLIDIDRRGFETWKSMTMEERQVYVDQAAKVNSAHEEALLEEVDGFPQVDDEADSAMVGKFDKRYGSYHEDLEYSNSFPNLSSEELKSFDTNSCDTGD
ncbi:hypothetical protein RJ641_005754 [Dillenia turbinata]|uniref:HMG box domain-containing protein n=1 Tax=Dillenia turbinata TaxID=194707 RepID=A0AAN8Z7K5_9MAGN